MTRFKKSPMALTLMGLCAASAFAEIKLTDNLSTSGFIDMSASGAKAEDVDATLNGSFDQFELDFMLKFGDKISARADISQGGVGGGAGAVMLEQGYATYSSGGAGFNIGRFLSASGFESAEPTGMYQYSYNNGIAYGGYENGISAFYTTPMFGLYAAVVTNVWSAIDNDFLSPGIEAQVSLTPAEGVTAKVTYLFDDEVADFAKDAAGDDSLAGITNQSVVNAWASYAKGPLTTGVEYSLLLNYGSADETGHGYMAMANYKLTDIIAATVRYSGKVVGDADPSTEVTFSPSLSLSPNWLVLAEVQQQIEGKATNYAVESTFFF